MEPGADLAALGHLIGDHNRAQMLQILLGGTPQSGSALAAATGISRSLASAHLKKLTAGGLVRAEPRGRQRLYTIAGQPVADALEALLVLAPASPVRSLRGAARQRSFRLARTCYDHLAGITGVAITEALTARDAIAEQDGAWVLGERARAVFAAAGIDVASVPRGSRPLVRPCADLTERGRHHLAGALGAAVAAEFVQRDWVRRHDGSRIVTVTPAGLTGVGDWLGVDLGRLRAAAA
jgi:DNA-binding transcriptional ArsR family regulator